MNSRAIAVLVGAAISVYSVSIDAQTTTGRLMGNMVDETGAPLPGVTVTIDSSVLIGGARTCLLYTSPSPRDS